MSIERINPRAVASTLPDPPAALSNMDILKGDSEMLLRSRASCWYQNVVLRGNRVREPVSEHCGLRAHSVPIVKLVSFPLRRQMISPVVAEIE